jgi:phage FluMu protein Com
MFSRIPKQNLEIDSSIDNKPFKCGKCGVKLRLPKDIPNDWNEIRCPKCKHVIKNNSTYSKSSEENKDQIELLPEEHFTQFILQILSNKGSMPLRNIGYEIRKFQEDNGWEKYGTGEFLSRHGLSGNTGLRKTIERLMPNRIIITGEHPEYRIELSLKDDGKGLISSDSVVGKEVLLETADLANNFPLIRGFNNGSSGSMNLPKNPAQYGDLIFEYCKIQKDVKTTEQLDIHFKPLISARRRNKMIGRFSNVLLPNDTNKRKDKDWTKAILIDNPIEIVNMIRDRMITNQEERPDGLGTEILHIYFDQVCLDISKRLE